MNREDMLNVEKLRTQSEHIRNSLSGNQNIINQSRIEVNKIKQRAGLSGKAYEAMREKMQMYSKVLDALYLANTLQVKDCKQLESMIGTESLDGHDIFDKIEHFTKEKEFYIKLSEYYGKLARFAADPSDKEDYEQQKTNALKVADSMEKLRLEYEDKKSKFDEISGKTRSLFSCVSNIREYARAGITAISEPLFADSRNVKYSHSWETKIKKELKKWTENSKVEISKDKYIQITDEDGRVWNGGSQFWYDDGTKEGFHLSDGGCGIIALLDEKLFFENKLRLTKSEYMKCMQQFLDDYDIRRDYESGNGYVPAKEGENNDLQDILSQIMKKYGGYSDAYWNTERNVDVQDVRDQLQHGIPTILVSSGFYRLRGSYEICPTLPFYEKNKDGELVRVKKLPLTEEEANIFKNQVANGYRPKETVQIDKDLNLLNPSVDGHAMTITGIEEQIDPDTYNFKTVFTVKSWGREYYVYADDVVERQEYRLNDYTDMKAKEAYLTTGNNNTSHVVY